MILVDSAAAAAVQNATAVVAACKQATAQMAAAADHNDHAEAAADFEPEATPSHCVVAAVPDDPVAAGL